jgi:hypothetical protein
MATSSVNVSYPERGAQALVGMKRYLILLWSIFVPCAAAVLLSAFLYSGTWFGLAVAFGGGIVAIECAIVIRKIRVRLRASAGVRHSALA